MPKPRRKIVDLTIKEGSAVDRGTNQRSKIVLFKRDGAARDADEPSNKEQGMPKPNKENVAKARSVEEILGAMSPEDKEVLNAYFAQMVDEAKASVVTPEEAKKADGEPEEKPADEEPAEKAEGEEKPEEDEMSKRFDEKVAAIEKRAEERVAELQKKLDDKESAERREKAVAKAASYGLPGAEAEKVADLMLAIGEKKAERETLNAVLESAAEVSKKLTSRISKAGASDVDADADPYTVLKVKAEEIKKNSSEKLTDAQAMKIAAEQNKDLASKC